MDPWQKCNVCKKPIAYQQKFWVCNVSTCNRRRLGLRFCSVSCYDSHLPDMNHRESWALEVKAPSQDEWKSYAAEQGEDAVWPPPVSTKKVKEAEPAQHVNPFGGASRTPSTAPAPVIRRRKE